MKLTIVGSSGSMSGPTSAASCYLLQEEYQGRTWSIAFDLGPGAFGQLWRYLDPRDLDALFLTHGHADHMGDIISLHVHHRWHPSGDLPTLPIYGPQGTRERTFEIDGWADPESFEGVFDFRVVQGEMVVEMGPFTITAFPTWHTVECYGFRVESPSGTFAYTGDTDSCEAIEQMADHVDVLLAECGFTATDTARGIHLDGYRVGELAAKAEVGQLVVTHVQPWTSTDTVAKEIAQTWTGPLSFAQPAQEYLVSPASS